MASLSFITGNYGWTTVPARTKTGRCILRLHATLGIWILFPPFNLCITLKYFEVGHTFIMEADSFHTRVETVQENEKHL